MSKKMRNGMTPEEFWEDYQAKEANGEFDKLTYHESKERRIARREAFEKRANSPEVQSWKAAQPRVDQTRPRF